MSDRGPNDPAAAVKRQRAKLGASPEYAAASLWRHVKSGGLYTLLAVGIDEKTLTLCVSYISREDGTVWVRPLTEWQERFKREA